MATAGKLGDFGFTNDRTVFVEAPGTVVVVDARGSPNPVEGVIEAVRILAEGRVEYVVEWWAGSERRSWTFPAHLVQPRERHVRMCRIGFAAGNG